VDDSEDTAALFKELLESEGATVQVASTAMVGLELLEQSEFDLVISDISMPDMDGYEFIRRLRATPGLERLPVIAASGLGRNRDKAEAQSVGFSAWLTKPIQVELLCETIYKLTGGAAAST
jgi:two-component system CheB/CheR fusion protein